MDTLENLRKAREIVARPDGWCRGWLTYKGALAGPAVCALGAVAAARGWDMRRTLRHDDKQEARESPEAEILAGVAGKLNPGIAIMRRPADTVIIFNDSSAQEDVVELFDTAICVLEKKQGEQT